MTMKEGKGKKTAIGPPTHRKYGEMIVQTLHVLKGQKGASKRAILKHIVQNYSLGDNLKAVSTTTSATLSHSST